MWKNHGENREEGDCGSFGEKWDHQWCATWFCTGQIVPNAAVDSYRRVDKMDGGKETIWLFLFWLQESLRFGATHETDEEDWELWNNWASTKMDQEFSTRQTTESKSRRSSFRMEKSDIWDPARFGVGAHPVCAVHQRSTTGSGISSCSFRRRHKGV